MVSARVQAYNGNLGAVLPVGSKGRTPGQGVTGSGEAKPSEAKSLLSVGHPNKANIWHIIYLTTKHSHENEGLREEHASRLLAQRPAKGCNIFLV